MMSANSALNEAQLTFSDLPVDDVIFRHIFPIVDLKTLFVLAGTCQSYRQMVHAYFERIHIVNIGPHGNKVSSAALRTLLSNMYCCTKLILKNCKSSLTDQLLEPAFEQNENIKHIDLTSCTSLTNNSLQTLATSNEHLQHLSLRDCVWASPEAVTNIGIHCCKLQYLDVSGCWHINDDTISTISVTCPRFVNVCHKYESLVLLIL